MRLPKAQKRARPHGLDDKKEVSLREEKFCLSLERSEEYICRGIWNEYFSFSTGGEGESGWN